MDERERAVQVELASEGDVDALQRLVVHYHAPLRGMLEAHMEPAVRRHLDPDDVLQDTYVAAFKRVAGCTFDGPGAFYKWLETIAVNQLKDHQRALKRQKRDVGRQLTGPPRASSTYPDLVHRLTSPDIPIEFSRGSLRVAVVTARSMGSAKRLHPSFARGHSRESCAVSGCIRSIGRRQLSRSRTRRNATHRRN